MSIFKSVQSIIRNPKQLSTYSTGLLQAKAYRAMKKQTRDLLEPYGISTVEWALVFFADVPADFFLLATLHSSFSAPSRLSTIVPGTMHILHSFAKF